jgi:site-specific recombinase XerD
VAATDITFTVPACGTRPETPGEDDVEWETGMGARQMAEYRKHLVRRHLAASTVERYMLDLRAFRLWLGRPLCEATPEEVESFLDSRDLASARSRYRWLSELHVFYAWAAKHQYVAIDPTILIERPRLSRLLPRPVDDDVVRAAMGCAGSQMRAWLALAGYGGLRCVEIATLDRASLGPDAMRIVGKGSHERIVPLHPVVLDSLSATHLARTGEIFRRENGQRYTAKEVSRRGALFHEMIGYPGVTLHQYRHNFGTRVYRFSKDLRAVQELLGHARLDTSAGYAAVGADDLVGAVMGLPEL